MAFRRAIIKSANKLLADFIMARRKHVDFTKIQNIIDRTAQPKHPDICADFAERLHNDAEMAGIRCAYVSLELSVILT